MLRALERLCFRGASGRSALVDTRGRSRLILRSAGIAAIACVAGARPTHAGERAVEDTSTHCAGAGAVLARIKPTIRGDVAALVPAISPLNLSQISFLRADGSPAKLADWSGKIVLVNLWATWCAPCRAEMPALARLQATLGSQGFQVLAINVDRASAGDKPQKFLAEAGMKALSFFSDPKLSIIALMQNSDRSIGLPTTLLIDGQGCEIGTMYGSTSWDTADAQRLIMAAVGRL